MSGLMTPVQAEKWLGGRRTFKGQGLVRAALKRERELGKPFVVKEGSGRGRRYKFSRAALMRYMPELCDDRFARTARRLEASVARLKEHIDTHIDERIENHPVIHTLQKQSEETIGLVESLAGQVERIAGVSDSSQR